MTLASDQQTDTEGLSGSSRRMLAMRETVFAEWEARVRASLAKARELARPILVDTLPSFYDNIAQSLTLDYPRLNGTDGTTLAAEHGGERARITAYDHEALIGEYQVFRSVLFEVFDREGLQLSVREVVAINASIDAGIQEAIGGFVLVHNALRERFAAALTHDLRAPLGAASTAIELMMMLDDPVKIRAIAARALDNVHRMDGMIHELLDTMAFHTGQQLALNVSSFDISEIVKEVQLDTVARHGARVEAVGSTVQGWWDRQALRRALENIVSNALKYASSESEVVIRTSETHGRLLLSVHNEGNPIPAQEQEAIFQMYRRAESTKLTHQQGWGVGLPYVRAVAESHGGSVGLDSTPERGTTFIIDIPLDCRPFSGAPTVA